MVQANLTILERAFEMAADGRFRTISEITRALTVERYDNVPSTMSSRSLRQSLRAIMRAKVKVAVADEASSQSR